MRNGTRRLLSLLTALVMACSLIAVPAAAAEENLPTVTLTSGQGQYKYIYASSTYNDLNNMAKLAVPVKGMLDGKEVELVPSWQPQADKLVNGATGSTSSSYGYNHFATQKFTVKDTSQEVTSGSASANLYVGVYALNADNQILEKDYMPVKKSVILGLQDSDNWSAALDLPIKATINYTPATIPNWGTPSEDLPVGTYTITGWQEGSNYNAAPLNTQALKIKAQESGNVTLELYPVYNENSIPKWATASNTTWRPKFTLVLVDNDPATVTVTAPASITYGEPLGEPTVTAADSSGNPLDGTFTYLYTGEYKSGDHSTTNYSSANKPTRVGKYKVTATFTSTDGTHSGVGYSQEFTINSKEVSITGDITAKSREYNNDYMTEIDISQATIEGKVDGDDLSIRGYGYFYGYRKDVGENLPVTIYCGLSGNDRYNYTLEGDKGNGQIERSGTASIYRKKIAIDDSEITVAKGYDGTTDPGTLGGKLGLHYDYYNLEIDQSGVIVSDYADAAVGINKTVTLSGIKLIDNGKPATNYQLTGEGVSGPDANETYTYEFKRAEITAKKWPVLGTDFTVEFPANPTYSGNAHEVTITNKASGLGEATVTYAKWAEYSPHWQPLKDGEKPTNAGTYKVTVSFAEGDSFAAMEGNNAFVLEDHLVIGKATEARDIEVNIAVPNKPGEMQWVFLSQIGLPESVTGDTNGGAYLKEAVNIGDVGGILAKAEAPVKAHYIHVWTKADAAGTQVLNLVLYSDNYETLNVKATISVGNIEISGVKVNDPGTFEYGTRLQEIIDRQSLSNATVTQNGQVVSASYISLKDAIKCYDARNDSYTSIEVKCTVNSLEYTVEVPVNFTITKKVIGEEDLGNSSDLDGFYKTFYANNPVNASADALLNWLTGEKTEYLTNIWLQESGPNPRLYLKVDSWTKDETVVNTAFDPKGTRLPTGVYAWYTYGAMLSLDAKYQSNYEISPDLKLKAYIRVLPINATQTLATNSAEKTTTEIAALTESSWKTALGLPGQASVKYNAPQDEPEILQAAGPLDTSNAPKAYNITKWQREDGTELTFDALQKLAAEADGNLDLKLTPVYDNAPAWATLEEAPTFTLTITVPNEEPYVKVREPYVFEYGTPLKDIIAVGGKGVVWTDDGAKNKIYDVGTYSTEEVTISVKKDGPTEEKTLTIPTFTIVPATIKSFDSESASFVKYGYWVTIYANNKKNTEEGLAKLLKESYTGYYGNGQKIELTADWSMDDSSCPYEPKGYAENVWYSFTAHLTPKSTGDQKVDANNFNISVGPKGYVRVIPANAYQTIRPVSKVVTKSTVKGLTVHTVVGKLNLPIWADIVYTHGTETAAAVSAFAEQSGDAASLLEESTAIAYMTAGAPPATAYRLARETTEAEEEPEEPEEPEVHSGQYEITGWQMDGKEYTNEKLVVALKEKADEIFDGQSVELTLTPVYGATEGDYTVPAWATLLEKPTFTLVITSEEGDLPADITFIEYPDRTSYGDTLTGPTINYPTGITKDDVTVTYEGMYGTEYNSVDKPTKAGKYRMVVTLKENPSVKWMSLVFNIEPKEVTISDVKCDPNGRMYDGTANANSVLDASKATIDGLVGNDDVKVEDPIGYFSEDKIGDKYIPGSGKNVGNSKTVVLIGVTLTGADADNYKLAPFFETKTDDKTGEEYEEPKAEFIFTGASKIIPKPLTIDDSGLTVTKAQSQGSWKLTGELKLGGVIGSEVRLDMSDVKVIGGESGVGTGKTVTLTGIKLVGTESDLKNYSLPDTLQKQADNTYHYTFSRAEITAMPRPELGTHFKVTIPAASDYNGNAREATYKTADGVTGLGTATVTYAKRLASGTYAEPTTEKPVGAGTYQVLVSFTKGDRFDAAKNVPAGTLTISKAAAATHTKEITVPAAATKTVLLSELDLPDAVAAGAKLKNKLDINTSTSGILESVTGTAGRDFFTLKTKTVESTQSGDFTIILTSDNYETVTVTVKLTVDSGALNITPPWATIKSPGYFEGDTALEDILELNGGSASQNGSPVEGTFAWKDPKQVCNPGTYTNHPFEVVFTSSDGQQTATVTIRASFTVNEPWVSDAITITISRLKDGKTVFEHGTAWKDILDFNYFTAKKNNEVIEGTFVPVDPLPDATVTGPNWYKSWPIRVQFTTSAGNEEVLTAYAPDFIVTGQGGGGGGGGAGGGGGGAGGGGGGAGGGGGKPSTGDPSTGDPGSPDDKKAVVETLEDGTVVTTVTDSQGYVARTEERPDGSILSTVHHVDGCNGTVETDTSGKTIAVADVPADVARAAVDGDPVLLPVVGIRAHKDIDKAPALVVNTFGVNGVKVRIPVENKGITVVAVEIKSDGTPVIVKNTIPTEDGIVLRMDHLEVIRFLDNRKNFVDTQGHWAADAIDFVSSRELFNGTTPNTFSPNAEMTRAMLVTVLARYAGADTAGGTTWYEKGAAWAMANGLSDGTRLNDHITREQLVTILYRYAILKGKAGDGDASLSDYADAESISNWAVNAMSWAVEVGLIKGTTSTTLDPQSSATRAQVAAVMMRYVEMFGL